MLRSKPGILAVVFCTLLGGCGGTNGATAPHLAGYYRGTVTLLPSNLSQTTQTAPVAIGVDSTGTVYADGYSDAFGVEFRYTKPNLATVVVNGAIAQGTFSVKKNGDNFDIKIADSSQTYLTAEVSTAPVPTLGAPGTAPAGSYSGEYVVFSGALVLGFGKTTAIIDGSSSMTALFHGSGLIGSSTFLSGTLGAAGVIDPAIILSSGTVYSQTNAHYGYESNVLTFSTDNLPTGSSFVIATLTPDAPQMATSRKKSGN